MQNVETLGRLTSGSDPHAPGLVDRRGHHSDFRPLLAMDASGTTRQCLNSMESGRTPSLIAGRMAGIAGRMAGYLPGLKVGVSRRH